MSQLRRFIGSKTSTMSRSLENLLTMRPIGVISKNEEGLRMRFESMRLLRTQLAMLVPKASSIEPPRTKQAGVVPTKGRLVGGVGDFGW